MPGGEPCLSIEKNRKNWDAYAGEYARFNHAPEILQPVLDDPAKAFHSATWNLLRQFFPDFRGRRVCVPSSGDNHAVFAFARLGAQVTSCDISEHQLAYAREAAQRAHLDNSIDFVCTDTMTLAGIADSIYDLVYTSNGVHVWLGDLPSMYRNIYRVLAPGGMNILYEIHPFQRPFDRDLKAIKPYDMTGPFEDESTVTFHWRLQDILNAIMDAGLRPVHMEEMFDEKNYVRPFWIKNADIIRGVRVSAEEVDRMYDWHKNPAMCLPAWLCVASQKTEK